MILDCFATWCSLCKVAISHLAEIMKNTISEVIVISVGSFTICERKLRQFRKGYGMDWLVAQDTVGVLEGWSVYAILTIVILDSNGNIPYRIGRMMPLLCQLE